jgi:hypothetical protein
MKVEIHLSLPREYGYHETIEEEAGRFPDDVGTLRVTERQNIAPLPSPTRVHLDARGIPQDAAAVDIGSPSPELDLDLVLICPDGNRVHDLLSIKDQMTQTTAAERWKEELAKALHEKIAGLVAKCFPT